MASGVTTTSTYGSNFLPSRWSNRLRLDAVEEMVIAKQFNAGDDAEKMNAGLYVRRIGAISAAAQAASGTITYSYNADSGIVVSPVWATAAVQIAHSVFTRMDVSPESAYRTQIVKGLAAYTDQQGGALATGLSTNLVGSGVVDADYTLIAELLGKIVGASADHYKLGQTEAWLIYHPTQHRYVMNQITLIADYIRGDGEKAVASGYVSKGGGFKFNESGNILQSGGISYNLAYTADAFVLAYNEQPRVLPPQDFDATVKIIATNEFGVSEIYDAYAGVMMTRG